MFLKNSISKAKKLLNKTLESFKAFVSGGYERLPKTPPLFNNPFSCGNSKTRQSFGDLDKFYCEFVDQWDTDQKKKKSKKKRIMEPANGEDPCNGSFMKFGKMREERREEEKEEEESSSQCVRVEECLSVAQKMKELEMMDRGNVDHVLDVEEVLHYYSRLKCPFYVDIVNKFFLEIYAEFLPHSSPLGKDHRRRVSDW